MYGFRIDDPNKGLALVVGELLAQGIHEETRNGPVLRFPEPVVLAYPDPTRRILDWEVRDANPFFHHFEAMWMLAGRQDVEPLLFFNPRMADYCDDGKIARGFGYGWRWRHHFGFDQIEAVIKRLRENPADRRGVLTMWDVQDLQADTQDFACNMQVIFTPVKLEEGYALDMLVTNRSNDLIYGTMGSNLYHFSILHEYMAKKTGMQLGTYSQMTTNLHIYLQNPASARVLEAVKEGVEPPEAPPSDSTLLDLHNQLGKDVEHFNRIVDWQSPLEWESEYLGTVCRPFFEAFRTFKKSSWEGELVVPSKVERVDRACKLLEMMPSPLGATGEEWLNRRLR
jgi:hypothetical protein